MINLINISKNFSNENNSIKIFKNANLQINKGKLLAIKGRSGSGKSTLLKILAGLDNNYEGDYYFMDKKLSKNNVKLSDFRLKNIGIITQDYQLLPDKTCYENIALPLKILKKNKKVIKKKVDETMNFLGVSQYKNKYPDDLSGGQQQRVAIARAMIKSPKLLIADEPTGALDMESEQEVLHSLKFMISKECTVIIATHSNAVSQWCDYIAEIKNQQITIE